MKASMWFDGEVQSVPRARHWLIDQLLVHGRDGRTGDAALCVSELAANVIRHTDSGFEVDITERDDSIRISVSDQNNESPTLRTPASKDPSGRGLLIVSKVASQWGVDQHEDGKTVWFELA